MAMSKATWGSEMSVPTLLAAGGRPAAAERRPPVGSTDERRWRLCGPRSPRAIVSVGRRHVLHVHARSAEGGAGHSAVMIAVAVSLGCIVAIAAAAYMVRKKRKQHTREQVGPAALCCVATWDVV